MTESSIETGSPKATKHDEGEGANESANKGQPVWYDDLVHILSTIDPDLEAPRIADMINKHLYPRVMKEKIEAKTIKNKIKSEGLRASCKRAYESSGAGGA